MIQHVEAGVFALCFFYLPPTVHHVLDAAVKLRRPGPTLRRTSKSA